MQTAIITRKRNKAFPKTASMLKNKTIFKKPRKRGTGTNVENLQARQAVLTKNDIKIMLANEVVRAQFPKTMPWTYEANQTNLNEKPIKQSGLKRQYQLRNQVSDTRKQVQEVSSNEECVKGRASKVLSKQVNVQVNNNIPTEAPKDDKLKMQVKKETLKSLKLMQRRPAKKSTLNKIDSEISVQKPKPTSKSVNKLPVTCKSGPRIKKEVSKTTSKAKIEENVNKDSLNSSRDSKVSELSFIKDISSSSTTSCVTVSSNDLFSIDKKIPKIKLVSIDCKIENAAKSNCDIVRHEEENKNRMLQETCEDDVDIPYTSHSSSTSSSDSSSIRSPEIDPTVENKTSEALTKISLQLRRRLDLDFINWIGTNENTNDYGDLFDDTRLKNDFPKEERDIIFSCKELNRILSKNNKENNNEKDKFNDTIRNESGQFTNEDNFGNIEDNTRETVIEKDKFNNTFGNESGQFTNEDNFGNIEDNTRETVIEKDKFNNTFGNESGLFTNEDNFGNIEDNTRETVIEKDKFNNTFGNESGLFTNEDNFGNIEDNTRETVIEKDKFNNTFGNESGQFTNEDNFGNIEDNTRETVIEKDKFNNTFGNESGLFTNEDNFGNIEDNTRETVIEKDKFNNTFGNESGLFTNEDNFGNIEDNTRETVIEKDKFNNTFGNESGLFTNEDNFGNIEDDTRETIIKKKSNKGDQGFDEFMERYNHNTMKNNSVEENDIDDIISLFAQSITGIDTCVRNNSKTASHMPENNEYIPEPIYKNKLTSTEVTYQPTLISKINAAEDHNPFANLCEKQNEDFTSIYKVNRISHGSSIHENRYQDFTKVVKSNYRPPMLMATVHRPMQGVKSLVFKGVCFFFLISSCKKTSCKFLHNFIEIDEIKTKLSYLSEDLFIEEYLLLRSWPQLRRKYGKCFVDECIKRKLSKMLIEMSIDFIMKANPSSEEDNMLKINVVEEALLYLNKVDLSSYVDLLMYQVQSFGHVTLCDFYMTTIANSQNFLRYKAVFINLIDFMCDMERAFAVNIATGLLERFIILPYDECLASRLMKILKNTDSVIFSNTLVGKLEKQLLFSNAALHKELLGLLGKSRTNTGLFESCPKIVTPDGVGPNKMNTNVTNKDIRLSQDTTNLDCVKTSWEQAITSTEDCNKLNPYMNDPVPNLAKKHFKSHYKWENKTVFDNIRFQSYMQPLRRPHWVGFQRRSFENLGVGPYKYQKLNPTTFFKITLKM